MIKCPTCSFENPAGFAFCGKCGSTLMAACPQCGFKNPPDFTFCGQCGASLTEERDHLTTADLDHLRAYLSPGLIEALRLDLPTPSPDLLGECVDHLSELLETVYTHLPVYVVEQLIKDPTPGRVSGQFIKGTLLFADISGFTAMSERLSRMGREGAEEITAIVNRYFRAMLEILRQHQGQLVKFGGDALLGLFPEPDSATLAVQAAVRMQAAMVDFARTETSQGVFFLQIKIGVRKGQFFAAQLGTPQGIEYALFGRDVNATAATESVAQAGQILLDRGTWEAIRVPCQTTPASFSDRYLIVNEIEPSTMQMDAFPPPFPDLAQAPLDNLRRAVEHLDACTPYLPAGLLARIAGDPHAVVLEGENRPVAVLFANVSGLGEITDRLGPGQEEQIVSGLNQYFVAMQNAIHRFGGVINKMDLYEHGDKLLAFFGAPLAHEDDAERAVRAALKMQETLSEINCSLPDQVGVADLCLEQKIGVSFGYVFAGYVGTSWRHEYTVMGDEVNLGARLMSVAEPGSIIVSSDVRRKVQALFNLDPRGKVELKGKSAPVPTFSVVGPRAIPEPLRGLEGMSSPLVGRQAEWEQLTAAMGQLLAGRGQIVTVVGEAGLGKSRLVAEMRQQTTDRQKPAVRWMEGRCLSYTESVSYWPFQEIVRQLAGVQPDDSETEAWNKLRDTLETWLSREEVEDTLPYLANFMNLQLKDMDKVRYLDAQALQRRTFIAISTLVEAQASPEHPLVLVVDDIHWIDQASLALLEHLMPLVNRVSLMLLLLYRPERTKACWQIHEKADREFSHCTTPIVLKRLTPVDVQQLLTNLVGVENWPAGLQELIQNRTEGNPLYLEEVIRTLVDDGMLFQNGDGRWHVSGGLESFKVPDTLQGVMMARLDRLEEPCRRTAQLASVVGRVFPFDLLAHIIPENGGILNQCVVRLQQHETIRETQRMPELVYTFKHAMMQQVCYTSLLARTRRLQHRKIAHYLRTSRSTGRREAEGNYALIAHHAFEGQDWPLALRYELLTGQQAKELYANHEAIDHLEKGLSSAEHLPPEETLAQRLTIHTDLGELLIITSQYDHALEHLNQALSLATEQEDQAAQARACRWLARVHELRSEYPAALEWIQRGLAALEEKKTADAAELRLLAGQINSRQGDNDAAIEQCQKGLLIAHELGEVTVLARTYNLLGRITRLRGKSPRAIEYFQQALDLYEQAGDIHGQALSHNLIANAHFDMGQWREADEHYGQARERFEKTGDLYFCAFVDNNLGGIALNQGRLDEALAFYRAALHSFEQIGGSPYVLGVLHMNLGATFIRRGEIDTARQHLQTSQEFYEQAQARDFLPELHRHFAEAALHAADYAQAQAQAQQALDLARELAMQGEEGNILRVLGEIATAQGALEQAETYLLQSLDILKDLGEEYTQARSDLSLARLYAAQGEHTEGLKALERCESIFERLDASLDLAAVQALRKELLATT